MVEFFNSEDNSSIKEKLVKQVKCCGDIQGRREGLVAVTNVHLEAPLTPSPGYLMCQYCLCQEPLQHRILWAGETTTTQIVLVFFSMVVNSGGDSSLGGDSSSSVKTTTAVSASATQAVVLLFCASLLLWLVALIWCNLPAQSLLPPECLADLSASANFSYARRK